MYQVFFYQYLLFKSQKGLGLLLYLPADFRWGISHNEQVLQKYNQTIVSLFSGYLRAYLKGLGSKTPVRFPSAQLPCKEA